MGKRFRLLNDKWQSKPELSRVMYNFIDILITPHNIQLFYNQPLLFSIPLAIDCSLSYLESKKPLVTFIGKKTPLQWLASYNKDERFIVISSSRFNNLTTSNVFENFLAFTTICFVVSVLFECLISSFPDSKCLKSWQNIKYYPMFFGAFAYLFIALSIAAKSHNLFRCHKTEKKPTHAKIFTISDDVDLARFTISKSLKARFTKAILTERLNRPNSEQSICELNKLRSKKTRWMILSREKTEKTQEIQQPFNFTEIYHRLEESDSPEQDLKPYLEELTLDTPTSALTQKARQSKPKPKKNHKPTLEKQSSQNALSMFKSDQFKNWLSTFSIGSVSTLDNQILRKEINTQTIKAVKFLLTNQTGTNLDLRKLQNSEVWELKLAPHKIRTYMLVLDKKGYILLGGIKKTQIADIKLANSLARNLIAQKLNSPGQIIP